MIYTIDRIEGAWAVLEDEQGQMSDLPLAQLPEGAGEGDVLEQQEEGWLLRPDLRQQRMARNRALLERLKRRREK